MARRLLESDNPFLHLLLLEAVPVPASKSSPGNGFAQPLDSQTEIMHYYGLLHRHYHSVFSTGSLLPLTVREAFAEEDGCVFWDTPAQLKEYGKSTRLTETPALRPS